MTKLTDRQQQVYTFLAAHIEDHGYPPTLQEIAAHLGITGNLGVIRHLKALQRQGLISRQAGSSRGITLSSRQTTTAATLPLIGSVRAGLPQLAIEEIEGQFTIDASLVKSKDSFLLRVKGDSMIEAHIIEGDLAIIRPQTTAENGEIVVAMIDGEATLKRFLRDDDQIRLQPENATMAPILLDAASDPVAIIGKVTGICRPLG
jgi:repressor LexA